MEKVTRSWNHRLLLRWTFYTITHLVFTLTKKKQLSSVNKVLLNIEQRTTCRICQSREIAKTSLKSPLSSQIQILTTTCQLKHRILSKAVWWHVRVEVRHFRDVMALKHLLKNSKCTKQNSTVRKKDQRRGSINQRSVHQKKRQRTNHLNRFQLIWRMTEVMRGISQLAGHQSIRTIARKRRRSRKNLAVNMRKHQACSMKVKNAP